MRHFANIRAVFLLAIFSGSLWAQTNFETSLHKTRAGKNYWYGSANGGFESLTNIPITDMGCNDCHGPTDANGNPYPEEFPGASCTDCHDSQFKVSQTQCYGCHGRQATEANKMKLPDVHRDAGMVCWDCHGSEDLHGDGTEYQSMLQPGAIKADCANEGCHPTLPETHDPYDPHDGALHCTSCHAKTVITCYNCHLESQVEAHVKRAYKPLNDFVLLVNRDKDNKVYPATFQSLTHDGKSFAAFGPFTAHTITAEGRKCDDCHKNQNVKDYFANGELKFATWNDTDSSLSWLKGVVPIPHDYDTTFKMDFLTYNGNTSDPAVPSKNWSKIGKETWDGHQMFFATPLTPYQMQMLNLDFGAAFNNFPTSLHATRAGKNYWYGTENGGFEKFTNVPIENMGCNDCHGPTDANGNPYPAEFPGASCDDCHGPNGQTTEAQCLGCHGRQATEINKMKLSDVHRTAEMKCWDCHGFEDLHGDGNQYNSMLEPGAIKADCSNEGCHADLDANHDKHNGKIHCTTCHAETVISCYNCHLESQVESHVKRAYKPLSNFMFLVNRTKDNKVYPATFQSVTYKGDAFAAFGPFTSHSIKREARGCTDCHANFGGQIEAITEYNTTGEIKFATWNENDSTLSWKQGIIPMPKDYKTKLKMDFLTYKGNTSDPAVASKNWAKIGKDQWDGHQMFFATPLTTTQMSKLGFDTTLTSVRETGVMPKEYKLMQNYPNPFNPKTVIQFSVPQKGNVELVVYNSLGEEIVTLVNEELSAGVYSVDFNAAHLASGVYFYSIKIADFSDTKKLVLLK